MFNNRISDGTSENFLHSGKTSVMGNIMLTQELAVRASACEIEAVHFIIDSFLNTSPALLYGAKTINELKELLNRYADFREKKKPKWNSSPSSSASTQSLLTSYGEMLCLNFSLFGHYTSDCEAPKRAKGFCFRCGSLSHTIKTCLEVPQKYTKSAMEPKTPRDEDSDEFPFFRYFTRPCLKNYKLKLSFMSIINLRQIKFKF
ncbi:uncharacterized protein LOC117186128 [Drosophila miranda]|uniref:uncharacterized protein LOC117186128 n=1 Tax=Drosophila miranda TaxID=7229 RepID=UPI00143F4D43|nr:uncharacterized protein LOC117186128 [Drosophila miranda]